MELTPLASELLAGPNFGVVATESPDGTIQQTVVWLREQDGEVVFSSAKTRAKLRNLERNPTISVLVIDHQNGYRYSAIRGVARLEDEGADELIDELSLAYDDQPWPEQPPRAPRTTVVVSPRRVTDHS